MYRNRLIEKKMVVRKKKKRNLDRVSTDPMGGSCHPSNNSIQKGGNFCKNKFISIIL